MYVCVCFHDKTRLKSPTLILEAKIQFLGDFGCLHERMQ